MNSLVFIAVGSCTQTLFVRKDIFRIGVPAGYLLSGQGREIPDRHTQTLDLREKRSSGTSKAENRH